MANENDYLIFLNPAQPPQAIAQPAQSAQTGQRDYYSEYMMLLTASQFLTTIQKVALYTESLADYETTELLNLTYKQQHAASEFTAQVEQQVVTQLAEFRAKIEATDAHVHTSNVRRLFESIGTPDPASVERVIRYYLTKANKSAADRDKIDLLVTRWGAFRIPGTERMVVLRSERHLKERLEKIFQELALPLDSSRPEKEVLAWLENYRETLLNVKKMSEIVEKNYKSQLREYKLELGNFFYRPAVMAAIVDVNVALHNVLQEFYLSERARLELYVDHAKKRRTGDLTEQASPLFSLMSRAEEMRQVLDQTQAAIVSQQVIDQAGGANAEGEGNVDKLIALLEQTLKRTNELSQQIQQEIAKKSEQ